VIGGTGEVVERVVAPTGSRFAGFGDESVYFVRMDDVDLEYLERFRIADREGSNGF
jgi:hypothetical protein